MRFILCVLALSLGVAQAAVPANLTNQTYNGSTISAGSYFNTNGSQTTFSNSAGTGITLPKGNNITGLEVNISGLLTSNGGAILINAPGQIVNLNGNIDVRGIYGNSVYGTNGNGGNVTVNAAYLFQNGNIYADGFNGGNVQFNVGGLTMGSTSRISATGQEVQYMEPDGPGFYNTASGAGGTVNINSTGQVSIPGGAYISTLGVGGNIEIVGSGVNMDGILNAQEFTLNPVAGAVAGPVGVGGTIKLIANDPQGDVSIGKDAIIQADDGTVSINANRNINQDGVILANGQPQHSLAEDPAYNTPGTGSMGEPGGNINLTAGSSIENSGRLQADGSGASGGIPAGVSPQEPGFPAGEQPAFSAGNGGVITVSASSIQNSGVIRANGGTPILASNQTILGAAGNGGTINFVGANPTGNGAVVTYQGIGSTNGTLGTINAPDPASSSNTLIGVWQKNN